MRKRLIILLFTAFVTFLTLGIVYKVYHLNTLEKDKANLPEFRFSTLKGLAFTKNDLKNVGNVVIIHYSVDCEFCSAEADSLQNNIRLFENATFVWISSATVDQIQVFKSKHKLLSETKYVFLVDSQNSFFDKFGPGPYPTMYVYNNVPRLIKEFHSKVPADSLLTVLK